MALPAQARCVVIGCGIVGNSLAYHLTRLGWRDVVLLDKGPLPNPGGSTGHASNFIYLVDHSKEMTALTVESVRQYRELGVFIRSGGVEVALTPERMQELTRRMASAASWGIEPVSLLSPAGVKELVPYIDETVTLVGFYAPSVGVVDSHGAGTLETAQETAAGRAGSPVGDRVSVHPGRLRRADAARVGADARDRRRRVGRGEVRDQRHPFPHARRHAGGGRVAGCERPLVGGGRLGQGGAGHRQGAGGVDGARFVRDRPPLVRHR